MLIHNNKIFQIDDLLNRIGAKLQLSNTVRETVAEKYDEVYETLKNSNVFEYDGVIYPQGSYALQTTVKPLGRDEFDLDVVIQFDKFWNSSLSSKEIISKVESALKTTYKKVEPKNRCVRVEFKEYKFHLDIVPAFPCSANNKNMIKVPNVETNYWKDSCPKGYIEWFEEQCRTQTVLLEKCERFDMKQEELTDQLPYSMKPPLKVAVQLAKRFRDVYFHKIKAKETPSIVITTLFAEEYDGNTSEYEAIANILKRIIEKIHATNGVMSIRNPVNNAEIISECWKNNKAAYVNFCNYIKEFAAKWKALLNADGIRERETILESMFDEQLAAQAILEQAIYTAKRRKADNLAISNSGTLSDKNQSNIPIKKNNFYGE